MAERWTLYGDPNCTVYSRGVHVEPDQNDLPYCSTIKFLIDMKATVRRLAQQPSNFDDEDDDGGMSFLEEDNWSVNEEDATIELQYNEPYDINMRTALSHTLSQLKVPFEAHESLVDSILFEAASTASCNYGAGRRVVRLAAEVDVYVVSELGADVDGGGGGGGGGERAFVPASKSSIEKLERARVEGASMVCSICMEEMVVGSEATRMPCSHLYHQGCIVEWLNKSGICPLCRFSLPAY